MKVQKKITKTVSNTQFNTLLGNVQEYLQQISRSVNILVNKCFPPKTVVWKRIRDLGKAATRGWPGLTVHQRSEALMYLESFKQCHPKKSYPRKKKVNWKCYSQYAPIFALLFAVRSDICTVIHTSYAYVHRGTDICAVIRSWKFTYFCFYFLFIENRVSGKI